MLHKNKKIPFQSCKKFPNTLFLLVSKMEKVNSVMEKMNLSLKNIYRLLMTNDFPIYSESVIDEKNRKGQTLLKFWYGLLINEFQDLPYGRIIWKNDGKRNRHISNLCNRNPEMKFYLEYATELSSRINAATLLNQIHRFSVFLSEKNYRHDILIRRIHEFLRIVETDDPHFSKSIAAHIENALSWEASGSHKNLFQAGYLLTVMMLYAAAGDSMDNSVMGVVKENALTVSYLWDLKNAPPKESESNVIYLTDRISFLQDKTLPHHRFFGREEELFDLMEMAAQGRKCLISGVGGVGKTELLRQLIQSCEQERSVDCMAIVPYIKGIIESFGRVFPGFQHQESDESFHYALYQIEEKVREGKRVLLLIDDMNNSLEDDPDLAKLASLSCGVVLTSRRMNLEGFETYHISDPSLNTCALIFRDNYGKPLTQDDRTLLNELLCRESLCHPLSLRLMASAARSNGWSVQQLVERLNTDNISLTWVEDDRILKLNQIYSQLYSYMQIPDSSQKLIELFAILPRDSYSVEFLNDVFAPVAGGADRAQLLRLLADHGWLEESHNGYTMHSLIAQCMRRKVLTEQRLAPILKCLASRIPEFPYLNPTYYHDDEIRRISEIYIHISQYITGSVSRELVMNVLCAMGCMFPPKQTMAQYQTFLSHLLKRCAECDDLVEVRFNATLACWQVGNLETIEAIYRKQHETLTVSTAEFLDFCLKGSGMATTMLQFSLAEEMLQQVFSDDAHPIQKATAYSQMAAIKEGIVNSEERLRWSQQGAEYVTNHPQCGIDAEFTILCDLCFCYLRFGKIELALPILKKLESHITEKALPDQKIRYLDLAGTYELNYGSLDKALEYFQKDLELLEMYYGKDMNYYALKGQVALAFQRMNRYDEAAETYCSVLSYARQAGNDSLLHIISNNLSVIYLDLGKLDEAIPHLNNALEFARKQGGIALGEGLKNMARAHGMLGEFEKEQECLSEAVPLLETAYGVQHPRAVAARKRLEELTSGEG